MRLGTIDNIRVVGNIHSSQTEVSFEEFVGEELTTMRDQLTTDFVELDNLVKTYENLYAFKNAVAKYGLTRSLISLADHDKSLSTMIPEVPAIESLLSDRSAKNSTDVVAAVEVKLGQLAEYMTQRIKDMIFNFGKKKGIMDGYLRSILNKMETLNTLLNKDDRVFNVEEAKDKMVKMPSYDDVIHLTPMIEKMFSISQELLDGKFPATSKEQVEWMAELDSKLSSVVSVCVYTFDKNKEEVIHNEDNKIHEVLKKQSLEALGYDSLDKFHTLYNLFNGSVSKAIDKGIVWNIKEPTEGDLRIHYRAVRQLVFVTVNNYFYAADWIIDSIPKALKAIYWCTEKKKD